MPRFSERERERIQQSLWEEGERLFAIHGLKKVTIDELVEAVGIAKASFYKFYEGKEYLYLDIVQRKQADIFRQLQMLLQENAVLSDRERIKQVFTKMHELMIKNPILVGIDKATIDIISRKVSSERLAVFATQNVDAVFLMEQQGIVFTQDIQTVSCAFQMLYQSWIGLQEKDETIRQKVIDMMLDGLIGQIVQEDSNSLF